MAHKKAYSRYFIILQQDENGYSLASDKLPSGYAKLETKNDKCKISYYVQNLKKEMEPYYIALICNKKDTKKIIRLGTMNIDDYGRAEITYEYGVDNVAGSRMAVDTVSGAAIIKFVNSNIISVMSGFSTTDVPSSWKDFEVFEVMREEEKTVLEEPVKEIAQPEVQEAPEEFREEKNIFDEYEKKIDEVKEYFKDEKEDDKKQDSRDNLKSLEQGTNEENSKEDNFADNTTIPVDTSVDYRDENNVNNSNKDEAKPNEEDRTTPTGVVGEFFRALVEDLEEIKDGCRDIKRCKWYKVKVNNMDDLCNTANYNKYTIMYYPMISYYPYMKKHGHYLLGYKFDSTGKMKYLVYGIPGTKSKMDQPYGGKSGFVTWIPLKPGEEKEDSFGYWLMFYDFRTSTIVIPVK